MSYRLCNGMRLCVLTIFCLCLPFSGLADDNGIVIIANKSASPGHLSKKQIRHIYMGSAAFDLVPVNLSADNHLRTVFNTRVVGLTESRIRSFWAQMKFTGRGEPPRELSSVKAAVEFVEMTPNGIAYVPADTKLSETIEVIFQFKD